MGLHTGELRLTGEGYAGRELHRAARIAASGHGGQVVVSAATRALVDGELTELGEHRLKDFDEPVPLFQLGRDTFPPLKTISNTNLPRPASSFVGRERERDELVALLGNGTRLLTLSGPGGSGKTRLAVEAASELVPAFKAGVFWVGLAALREPALVTAAIAQTLGSKNGLAAHIGERELLVLLDNFEQVVQSLVDKSLLRHTGERLWMLETIREYAREQLAASGEEAELRRRHAPFVLDAAEAGLSAAEETGDQGPWLALLSAEHDNARAALEWARDAHEDEVLLRLVSALAGLWLAHAHTLEGEHWIALALERGVSPPSARRPS